MLSVESRLQTRYLFIWLSSRTTSRPQINPPIFDRLSSDAHLLLQARPADSAQPTQLQTRSVPLKQDLHSERPVVPAVSSAETRVSPIKVVPSSDLTFPSKHRYIRLDGRIRRSCCPRCVIRRTIREHDQRFRSQACGYNHDLWRTSRDGYRTLWRQTSYRDGDRWIRCRARQRTCATRYEWKPCAAVSTLEGKGRNGSECWMGGVQHHYVHA